MNSVTLIRSVLYTTMLLLSACDSGGGNNTCAAGFYGDTCQCQAGTPVVVNFTAMGTTVVPSLVFSGGIVIGSADIGLLDKNGMGVVGGIANYLLDGVESLTYTFTDPVVDVSYRVLQATNLDADLFVGESFVEPNNANGMSIGSFAVNGAGDFDVSDLAGQEPLSSFTVTADNDGLETGYLTYSPLVCTP